MQVGRLCGYSARRTEALVGHLCRVHGGAAAAVHRQPGDSVAAVGLSWQQHAQASLSWLFLALSTRSASEKCC